MNERSVEGIKALWKQGRGTEARQLLVSLARDAEDYQEYLTLCRWRKRIGPPETAPAKELRIALLGGATTAFLEAPLELELETWCLGSRILSSEFNTHAHEMLDAGSKTALFAPDIAVLLISPFNIAVWPNPGDDVDRVQSLVDETCAAWLDACEAFHARSPCEIVMSNLHMLPARVHGNYGCRLPWDRNSFLRRLNATLSARAPQFVRMLDVETLSSIHGIGRWVDSRFWYHAKQPVSFGCLVPFVRNLASIIAAIYGRTAKCVVVDLDNTLWGGVVGDDGVHGIRIGAGDAEGEAFLAFQEYLLGLKQRGVLLAVASKNEKEDALAPFEERSEMVLRREDFVSFEANWEPKPGSLERIAQVLNIGLDSLVFVDDNPAERELVRQSLPSVKVIELPEDPADFPRSLDQSGWFDLVNLTSEDREKTSLYRANHERTQIQSPHGDYGEYLASLEQVVVLEPFIEENLDRITQLINKTNQFNLTARRLSRPQVEAIMNRPDTVNITARLSDRFGDNGLVSVLSGHREGAVLTIDLWLMSCRVFNRGVEFLLANHLFQRATELDVELVRGDYLPTTKNKIVAGLYQELAFQRVESAHDGASSWQIHVKDYEPRPVRISVEERRAHA